MFLEDSFQVPLVKHFPGTKIVMGKRDNILCSSSSKWGRSSWNKSENFSFNPNLKTAEVKFLFTQDLHLINELEQFFLGFIS